MNIEKDEMKQGERVYRKGDVEEEEEQEQEEEDEEHEEYSYIRSVECKETVGNRRVHIIVWKAVLS